MNIFDDLEKYSRNIAIVTKSSKKISYKVLLDAADSIGKHIKNRCLVFLVNKNNFESVAGYLGFMRAKAVLVLINDTIDNILFSNLLDKYKPEYIFLPSKISQSNFNFTAVYSYKNYALIQTDYDIDYTLHDDLALLLTT